MESEEEEVRAIINCTEDNKKKLYIKLYNIEITYKDLKSLMPKEHVKDNYRPTEAWLTGEIIEAAIKVKTDGNTSVTVFSSYFYEQLKRAGQERYIQQHKKFINSLVNSKTNIAFIPVNEKNNHWILVVILRDEATLLLMEGNQQLYPEENESVVNQISALLETIGFIKCKIKPMFPGDTIDGVESTLPVQANKDNQNCGVIVIKYVEEIMTLVSNEMIQTSDIYMELRSQTYDWNNSENSLWKIRRQFLTEFIRQRRVKVWLNTPNTPGGYLEEILNTYPEQSSAEEEYSFNNSPGEYLEEIPCTSIVQSCEAVQIKEEFCTPSQEQSSSNSHVSCKEYVEFDTYVQWMENSSSPDLEEMQSTSLEDMLEIIREDEQKKSWKETENLEKKSLKETENLEKKSWKDTENLEDLLENLGAVPGMKPWDIIELLIQNEPQAIDDWIKRADNGKFKFGNRGNRRRIRKIYHDVNRHRLARKREKKRKK